MKRQSVAIIQRLTQYSNKLPSISSCQDFKKAGSLSNQLIRRFSSRKVESKQTLLRKNKIVRRIFYESRYTYYNVNKAFAELKNEGLSEPSADILYSNVNFTKGLESLINKQFDQAILLLNRSLQEISMAGDDQPDILSTIYRKLSFCYHSVNNNEELEQALRTIFIIETANPVPNTYQIFKAVYNLLVFYSKEKPEAGMAFHKELNELLGDIILPPLLLGEIDLLGGNCYSKCRRFEDACKVFKKIADDPSAGCNTRGMALNNYVVNRFFQAKKEQMGGLSGGEQAGQTDNSGAVDPQKEIRELESYLRQSVAFIEGLADDADETLVENTERKVTEEQAKNTAMLLEGEIMLHNNLKKEDFLRKRLKDFSIYSIHSLVPLMNLAELAMTRYPDGDAESLFYAYLSIGIAKGHNELAAAFRSMIHILEVDFRQTSSKSLELTQDILKYLNRYHISNSLKRRALSVYMMLLTKEERHFEANEVFEMIDAITSDDAATIDAELMEEMIFTPDYFF